MRPYALRMQPYAVRMHFFAEIEKPIKSRAESACREPYALYAPLLGVGVFSAFFLLREVHTVHTAAYGSHRNPALALLPVGIGTLPARQNQKCIRRCIRLFGRKTPIDPLSTEYPKSGYSYSMARLPGRWADMAPYGVSWPLWRASAGKADREFWRPARHWYAQDATHSHGHGQQPTIGRQEGQERRVLHTHDRHRARARPLQGPLQRQGRPVQLRRPVRERLLQTLRIELQPPGIEASDSHMLQRLPHRRRRVPVIPVRR